MREFTEILEAAETGDVKAANELLPLVYDELKQIAARLFALEPDGHSLQPTALVHEAYLRLAGKDNLPRWKGQCTF